MIPNLRPPAGICLESTNRCCMAGQATPAPYVDLIRALVRETKGLISPGPKALFLGTLPGGDRLTTAIIAE